MFLLDTDHIGIIQRQTEPEFPRLWRRMQAHPIEAFSTSIISFHEQALGWCTYLSRAKGTDGLVRGYRMLEQILVDFSAASVLPFDSAAAAMFESLRSQRIRVATLDLRIAAIALVQRKTLLTRNMKDFRQVPGLRVEDWTAENAEQT